MILPSQVQWKTPVEIWVRVTPRKYFGLADPDSEVVPDGGLPTFNADFNTGEAWLTLPDGRPNERLESERVQIGFSLNRMRVQFDDNVARVIVQEADDMTAVAYAEGQILRLMQLFMAMQPNSGDRPAVQSFRIIRNDKARHRMPETGNRFYVYNTNETSRLIREAAELLDGLPSSARLDRALAYFVLGDDILRLRSDWATEESFQSLLPLRFLQFWKALTVITGDTSDKDHQSRSKKLGLGSQFYSDRVKPLKDLRDQFDVAHVADPDAPRVVSVEDVSSCRATASDAILGFATALRS